MPYLSRQVGQGGASSATSSRSRECAQAPWPWVGSAFGRTSESGGEEGTPDDACRFCPACCATAGRLRRLRRAECAATDGLGDSFGDSRTTGVGSRGDTVTSRIAAADRADCHATARHGTARHDDLARLLVRSATFTRTSSRDWDRQRVGPFDVERFVSKLSGTPQEDRQLLARTGFVRGYASIRMSSDDRRLVVYLYRFRSHQGAVTLQNRFWGQYEHGDTFTVRGISRTWTDSGLKKKSSPTLFTAGANVNFVVGNVLAQVTVTESSKTIDGLRPDTRLAATISNLQHDLLNAAD
jgi:hypothetical protein